MDDVYSVSKKEIVLNDRNLVEVIKFDPSRVQSVILPHSGRYPNRVEFYVKPDKSIVLPPALFTTASDLSRVISPAYKGSIYAEYTAVFNEPSTVSFQILEFLRY